MHPVLLQPPTTHNQFLAFCNDFDTHYHMFAYILLRNKILLFPKGCKKPIRPIFPYFTVVNMEEGNFTN